jgi:5-methylcytosine-specific restriction endonuclease McrA
MKIRGFWPSLCEKWPRECGIGTILERSGRSLHGGGPRRTDENIECAAPKSVRQVVPVRRDTPVMVAASTMVATSALDHHVLVLNRFYMPIRVISARRALTLLYRDCCEVIAVEGTHYVNFDFNSWCELSQLQATEKLPGEDYIRTPGFELQLPRIIRLSRFERMPAQTVRFSRKNIFARDDFQCQYCGLKKPSNQLSLDHVIPRSLGGKTTWENIVCCCLRCNSRKGGRTPAQAAMTLLTHPAKPRYNPALGLPLSDPRYDCWKNFLPAAG